jgi:hypothetical protein
MGGTSSLTFLVLVGCAAFGLSLAFHFVFNVLAIGFLLDIFMLLQFRKHEISVINKFAMLNYCKITSLLSGGHTNSKVLTHVFEAIFHKLM